MPRKPTTRDVEKTLKTLKGVIPEILVSLAIATGWLLLTYGISLYTSGKVWPISIGLFLLSLCGWRFVGVLFTDGLYKLTGVKSRGR